MDKVYEHNRKSQSEREKKSLCPSKKLRQWGYMAHRQKDNMSPPLEVLIKAVSSTVNGKNLMDTLVEMDPGCCFFQSYNKSYDNHHSSWQNIAEYCSYFAP